MSTSGKARDTGMQMTHFLRKRVNFNDTGIGTLNTVKVGTLPAGALITLMAARVNTVFNAVTTNVLTFGTDSATNANLAGAGDINEASATYQNITTGLGLAITADTDVFVRYTQTGTAATTGQADIVILYIPNSDG